MVCVIRIIKKRASGFTLVELLVSIAIIGILAATATQNYLGMRKRAFDSRALSDLRNVVGAEESYFAEYQTYKDCTDSACSTLPGVVSLSEGVTIGIASTSSGFLGSASHPLGSGLTYNWDSSGGGLQ